MGKNKNKDEIPNPNSVTNRDILQRLNFLYQASVFLNTLQPAPTPTSPDAVPDASSSRPSKSTKKRRRVVSVSELSRSYVDTMKVVGQKTNVRMDPSVKRVICKGCSAILIPGISATVRVHASASHGHLISYQCHCCQTERRLPAPPVLHEEESPPDKDAMDAEPEGQTQTQGNMDSSTAMSRVGGPVRSKPTKRKKGQPVPRLPPHFARDSGHVVFRGNERLQS